MIARALALLALAALYGCFESSVPLGPPERVMVNPGFAGTWKCERANGAVTVTIIPYDASRYYVESSDGKETVRYAAHSSVVGGALLQNVKDLDEAAVLREIRRRVNADALYEPWAKCRK